MTFEFFTPEGVSVRCETVEELTDAYTSLWRNHEHTSYGFHPDIPNIAPHTETEVTPVPVRHLAPLPPLEEVWNESGNSEEVENPTIMMPKHWAAIWADLVKFGEQGTSMASVALRTGRNVNTTWTTARHMECSGFIEKSQQRGLWRVPVRYRHHKLVVSRVVAVKG